MKAVSAISLILVVVHLFALIIHNTYRLAKLQSYLRNFSKEGILSSSEHEELRERFNSFFKLYEPLPDEFEYPKLFENVSFMRFVDTSRKVRKYLVISLILLTSITFFTAPKQ
jgi:hypothetical protein